MIGGERVTPDYVSNIRCFVCGRYLGTIDNDSRYMRFAPCWCGWQWVGELVSKRPKRQVETPAGMLEVKAR